MQSLESTDRADANPPADRFRLPRVRLRPRPRAGWSMATGSSSMTVSADRLLTLGGVTVIEYDIAAGTVVAC